MDNYNYPAGADNEDAPWNQWEPSPMNVDVCVSATLSKSTTIETSNYSIDEWEDYDNNDEGGYTHTGGRSYEYHDLMADYSQQEYTISELLDLLAKMCRDKLEEIDARDIPDKEKRKLKHKTQIILRSCEGWNEDELEVIEE